MTNEELDEAEREPDTNMRATWVSPLVAEVRRLRGLLGLDKGKGHWAEPNEPHAPTFIQWKGTEVCMDVTCPKCKRRDHIDADFAYALLCVGCNTLWKLGQSVSMVEFPRDTWDGCEPIVIGEVDPGTGQAHPSTPESGEDQRR